MPGTAWLCRPVTQQVHGWQHRRGRAVPGLTRPRRCRAGFLPLLILNSCLAYCQNLSNFLVTKHTSALTLQARAALPLASAPLSADLVCLGQALPKGGPFAGPA